MRNKFNKLNNLFNIFINKGSVKFYKLNENLILNKILYEISNVKAFTKKINYDNFFFKFIYDNKNLDLELITRQIILHKLLNVKIVSKLVFFNYYFFNFFFLCVPNNYQRFFKRQLNLNSFLSSILFIFFLFYQLLRGLIIFLRILFSKHKKMFENSLFLYGFPDASTNLEKNNNFINWLIKNNSSNEKTVYYSSNSKIENKNLSDHNIISKSHSEIFVNIKLSKKIYFLLWFIFLFFYSILSCFFLRWWHLFLLPETVKFRYISFINSNHIPNKFLFTLSDLVYKPMWSYSLEKNQKTTILVNYGPSISGVNYKDKLIHYPGFITQSWNTRYEYSIEYIKYLKNILIKDFKFTLFKEIDWLGSDISFKTISKKKIITVFDSTPFNKLEKLLRLYFNELGDENFSIKFLKDIIEVCEELDYYLIIKPKKLSDNEISNNYMKFLEQLSKSKNISVINEAAPKQFFDISNAVISFPFTSTAVLAKNHNKKICFYKPSIIAKQDSIQNLGITTIYNKLQLKSWLNNIYKET